MHGRKARDKLEVIEEINGHKVYKKRIDILKVVDACLIECSCSQKYWESSDYLKQGGEVSCKRHDRTTFKEK